MATIDQGQAISVNGMKIVLSLLRSLNYLNLFFVFGTHFVKADDANSIPDVATTAQQLASNVRGIYRSFDEGTSNKMPDGPVAGNGNVGLILSGQSDEIHFNVGKSDFWGVFKGAIAPVGCLKLRIPELKGAISQVEENIGPATLTGKFTTSANELCLKSWVSATQNLIVIELRNTGAHSLDLTSSLWDGLGTSGNEATWGFASNSTWLKVSPDTLKVDVGNRFSMGPRGGFHGKIADLRIFDQPINPTLVNLDQITPIINWPSSGDKTEHGYTAQFHGGNDCGSTIGALLIPQKGFTITAWVNADSVDALNFILSSMISAYGKDQHRPSQQRYQSGFALDLDNGYLSATLNYTSTKAAVAFPLNQWVQVCAIYNGNALTLYQDGTSVATTTDFPSVEDVMGWQKTAIHKGLKGVPFDGCAPEGILLQRIIGPDVNRDEHELKFTLESGAEATIVVHVMTDRDTPDFVKESQDTALEASKESLDRLFQEHTQWWQHFWSKSFVKIPNQKIQDNWYASLYLLACCSNANCPAPGLWGNFVTGNPEWQGDYTLDYNYEAPFRAALPCNHLELTDNYEKMMLDHIPRGISIANHNNLKGLYWYCHLSPAPGWSDDYGDFWGQKSGSLFAVVNCAQRWRYTHDLTYGKKIYPLLRGVAEFWDNYLVLKDGRYIDQDDSAGENTGHDTNPATTLAFMRLVYPTLIELSQILNSDADRREKWNDILDKLSPLPIVPANEIGAGLEQIDPSVLKGDRLFIRNTESGSNFPDPQFSKYMSYKSTPHDGAHSCAGMNSSQVIFPGWSIGLESSDREREAAYNTVLADAQWFDFNDDCTYYPSAAAIGIDPTLILNNLEVLLNTETPNYIFHTGGGGTEDLSVVPATLSLMFIQSYQQNIHLFPNWPMDQDAAFGNLNACGGFLVSSEVDHGRIPYLKIESTAGRPCHIVNPWPNSTLRILSNKQPVRTFNGSLLVLSTSSGEVITILPYP